MLNLSTKKFDVQATIASIEINVLRSTNIVVANHPFIHSSMNGVVWSALKGKIT